MLLCSGPPRPDWSDHSVLVTTLAPLNSGKMLQTGNYSLVLLIQLTLLAYDLFVNSFSELLRSAPVIQLVLFM